MKKEYYWFRFKKLKLSSMLIVKAIAMPIHLFQINCNCYNYYNKSKLVACKNSFLHNFLRIKSSNVMPACHILSWLNLCHAT